MRKKKKATKHKSLLPNLEKELKRLFAKIILECGKEISFLKKTAKEITLDVKKAKVLQQLANRKDEHLASRKNSLKQSEKKQWQATKKLQQEVEKMIATSNSKILQFEKEIEKLELKKNQFNDLSDQLKQSKNSTRLNKKETIKKIPTHEPLLQPPMFPTFQIFQD